MDNIGKDLSNRYFVINKFDSVKRIDAIVLEFDGPIDRDEAVEWAAKLVKRTNVNLFHLLNKKDSNAN